MNLSRKVKIAGFGIPLYLIVTSVAVLAVWAFLGYIQNQEFNTRSYFDDEISYTTNIDVPFEMDTSNGNGNVTQTRFVKALSDVAGTKTHYLTMYATLTKTDILDECSDYENDCYISECREIWDSGTGPMSGVLTEAEYTSGSSTSLNPDGKMAGIECDVKCVENACDQDLDLELEITHDGTN